jgi:hypothetical protein
LSDLEVFKGKSTYSVDRQNGAKLQDIIFIGTFCHAYDEGGIILYEEVA